MESTISKRLLDIVLALPLKDGVRVLEIGCGPGAMAREMSRRIKNGHVLAIDRSEKAIRKAISGSESEMATGKLSYRQVAADQFELEPDEELFDFAIAVRVGALDGRHPHLERQSLIKISKALRNKGKLYTDGGNPLREVCLDEFTINDSVAND